MWKGQGISVSKPLKRICRPAVIAGGHLWRGAENAAQTLLDFFVEDLCALCGRRPLRSTGVVDGPRACFDGGCVIVRCLGVQLSNRPVCRWCARKLEPARAVGTLAGGDRGGLIAVHAPFMTNDALLQIVHLIKFKRYHALIPLAARAIARSPGVGCGMAGVLVPVPMEKSERRQRRFDHAAYIARCLGGQLAIPLAPNALIKTRRTQRQSQTPHADKAANVTGAFLADAGLVAGKPVFVVDDLVTSGATAAACACALVDAGAASVRVFALGRAL